MNLVYGVVEEHIHAFGLMYASSSETFSEENEQDREFLQLFSFICTLSFDVYVKKQIIEKLIDSLPEKFPNYYEKKK